MRILVVGVSGFIGSAVAARLCARGEEVIGLSRSRPPADPPMRHIALDVARLRTDAEWRPHLQGIDAVVYCAGALQDVRGDSLEAVHHEAPLALFRACVAAGIRRVIYFSAIGVDREAPTAFSRTKRAGERALMALDLDWVILRPSVVIGCGAYGGSALLRGLAALPILPLPPRSGALQVVHLDDVVQTVVHSLGPNSTGRVALDLVGPHPWPLADLVGVFRRWLGWPRARVMTLPAWLGAVFFRLGDIAGWFGWQAAAVVVAGALCDIAVGLAIAWRRTARLGVIAAFVVTILYALIGTVLVPRLWADPMGPMLKVMPILVLHLAALGIVDDR